MMAMPFSDGSMRLIRVAEALGYVRLRAGSRYPQWTHPGVRVPVQIPYDVAPGSSEFAAVYLALLQGAGISVDDPHGIARHRVGRWTPEDIRDALRIAQAAVYRRNRGLGARLRALSEIDQFMRQPPSSRA